MKVFPLIVLTFAVFITAESRTLDNPSIDKIDALDTKPQQNNDLGIEKNKKDILQQDDDETDDIFIPSLQQLTTDSDPIKLGQQINKIADPEKRKQLIDELKKARDTNKDSLPGKFYQAALTSIKNEEKAAYYWANELETATSTVLKSYADLVGNIGGIGSMTSNIIGNARTLARINPLGIALRRGESVLLTVLSDASKNTAKFSDSVYDTAADVYGINKKLTGRLQGVPFVGEIKGNVDETVEDHLKRGKFLVGSFADAGAQTFATLANDSAKKADEKEELLKQFTADAN